MNVLACDLAGENMAVHLLAAAKELEWVCTELQSTAQVRDEAIFNYRLTRLPMGINKTERWQTLLSKKTKLTATDQI